MPDACPDRYIRLVATTDDLDRRAGRHKDRRVLGMVLLALGVVFFLGHAGLFQAAGRTLVSAALVAIGVGLIVTRRSSRPRWPIFAGAILTFGLIGHSAAQNFQQDFGDALGSHVYTPHKLSQVHSKYQLAAGTMTVNLSHVRFSTTTVKRVKVDVAAGQAQVTIPDGVPVEVIAKAEAGTVRFGRTQANPFGGNTWTANSFDDKHGLILDVHVLAGSISIDQAGS
jgi:hypothetical protein